VRGCLFVLLAAALLISVGAWFGSPLLASTVLGVTLQNAGFVSDRMTITASAEPPPKLLLGRADRVEIDASGVSFRTFHAGSLDLVLTDVDLMARTADEISGTVTDASVKTADGVATNADVTIDGPATGADARIVVAGATIDRVVRSTFEDEVGVAITRTELAAPDILRIITPNATLEGRLVVDATGAIALSTRLGVSPILSFDRSFPLRLRSVRVDGDDLRIDGTLDAIALLGG